MQNTPKKPILGMVIITIILLVIYLFLLRYTKTRIINYPVVDGVIQIGQTAVFSGTSAYLGNTYREGMELGLLAAQSEYDVQVTVYSLNDGYEPDHALNNARLFKEYYDVFAVMGTVGTPTSVAVASYLSTKNTPLIGPFSGSSLLRYPFNRYVVNLRPSYRDEINTIFAFFSSRKIHDFGFFYQDDIFGLSVFNDLSSAISGYRHLNLIGRGGYKRNELWLEEAYSSILQVDHPHDKLEVMKSPVLKRLSALILVSTADQAEKCIRYFKLLKPSLYIVCISFVGTQALGRLIASSQVPYNKDNIYTTDIYSPGYDPTSQLDRMMLAQDPNARLVSIVKEGFVMSLFFGHIIAILRANAMEVTKDNFLNCIYTYQNFTVAGIHFGPFYEGNNQGQSTVYIIRYDTKDSKFIKLA